MVEPWYESKKNIRKMLNLSVKFAPNCSSVVRVEAYKSRLNKPCKRHFQTVLYHLNYHCTALIFQDIFRSVPKIEKRVFKEKPPPKSKFVYLIFFFLYLKKILYSLNIWTHPLESECDNHCTMMLYSWNETSWYTYYNHKIPWLLTMKRVSKILGKLL